MIAPMYDLYHCSESDADATDKVTFHQDNQCLLINLNRPRINCLHKAASEKLDDRLADGHSQKKSYKGITLNINPYSAEVAFFTNLKWNCQGKFQLQVAEKYFNF